MTAPKSQTISNGCWRYFPNSGNGFHNAMARALMSRPRMIVMDEPTMGLSPLFVDRVLDLIRTINKEGVSIFMVEQNASLALEIAHEAYVLQTGRIVLSGPARALKDDPRVRDAYLGGAEVA